MADVLVGDEPLIALLRRARTIAVLGAHTDRERPAFFVPDYLHHQGYRILPVNPKFEGQVLWGEPVLGNLREIQEYVDIVEVFRRSRAVADHLPDILGMRLHPGAVWLQSGIHHDAVARQLVTAGIDVVQDRCMMVEHRRSQLGRVGT